ncbi:MAG: hypothetical protein LBM93_12465 [Oscillospiraceae bacterium]|jgi:hypothetical protein|nr:hypothetical protein [Oscillospiraceae bacterium]
MGFRQNDYTPYSPLTPDERNGEKRQLLQFLFKKVAPEINFSEDNILINDMALNEVIEMVNKRHLYFKVFHKGMKLGEPNETALYCYWILKLNPFFDKTEKNRNINVWFSLGMMFTMAKELAEEEICISKNMFKTILHSFEYHELTKEAIMDIVWTLIKNPKTQ